MGTIQKSSLRLTFGLILAFTISALINVGLSTPSSAASYKRINNQVIVEGINYYVADGLVPPSDYSTDTQFWNIKKSKPTAGLCEKYLIAQHSTAGPLYWLLSTSAQITNGNLCAEAKDTTLPPPPLDNSGSNYFFYQSNPDVIKPVLTISSAFEFTRITHGLGQAPKDRTYIQTKPANASLCPRLLVYKASTNNWGFIEPFVSSQALVDNTESVWYRTTLKLGGITGKDNCNADQGTDTQHQTEIGLSKTIGGTDAFWSKDQGWNPMDFYGLSVVKALGNAVAPDESAAQMRNNGVPAGSIAPPPPISQIGGKDVTGASTCGISGIGWIVCPVMNFMGTITDFAFGFIANNFLETKVEVISNPAMVNAWGVMRSIANVAFVIAFLIIIFSQLSSVGITNYGVKKMLPRLVVAAILVNLSYLICQIAVDVSNILGYSIYNMFAGFQNYTQTSGGVIADASTNPAGIAVIVAGVVAGSLTLVFAVTVPVLLAALLALMMIVLILFGRTALIVLLVVISPLAFVAYLLPNTEQWFKKWYKMFSSLLLLFPIVAVVFGAAGLAAGILNASAIAASDKMGQIIAVGVATIPLFIVPSLLKNSLSAAGTIGTKLAGLSSKASGRVSGKVRDTSKLSQLKKYNDQQGQVRRAKILGGVDPRRGGGRNPLNWASRANNSFNNAGVSGAFGDKAKATGQSIADKLSEDDIAAATTTLQAKSSQDVLKIANESKDEAERTAAVRQVMKVGSHDEKRAVLANAHTASAKTRSSIRDGYYASGMNDVYGNGLGDEILDMENTEPLKLDDAMRANFGSMSAKTLVSSKKASTDIARVVNAAETSDEARAKLSLAINSVNESVELKDKITEDVQEQFDIISKRVAGSTPQSPPPAGPPPTPPPATP